MRYHKSVLAAASRRIHKLIPRLPKMKLNIWLVFLASVADIAFAENTPLDYPRAKDVQRVTVVRDLSKMNNVTYDFFPKSKPRSAQPPEARINLAVGDGQPIFSQKMRLYDLSVEGLPKSDNKVEYAPVTFDTIKKKLKASGVFDWNSTELSKEERKQLKGLRKTIELMMTSRARQPSNVQNTFASLRSVQRIVKKLVADGQMTKSLANKFNWQMISNV